MKYIFIMGLSGSLLWIMYLVVKAVSGSRFDVKWRYRFLKCVLFYFLAPVPFLKNFYVYLWENAANCIPDKRVIIMHSGDNGILWFDDGLYFNRHMKVQLCVGIVWIIVIALIVIRKAVLAIRVRKNFVRHGEMAKMADDDAGKEMRVNLQKKCGIKGNVTYIDSTYTDDSGSTAFTIGFFKPVILYPAKRSPEEQSLILEHELRHIKRKDIMWRVLASCACLLHWYNPLTWMFVRELDGVSEMACDDDVLRGKGDSERALYMKLLKDMLVKGRKRHITDASLSNGSKKILMERMENIMNGQQNSMKGAVCGLVIAAAVFLNSFTALAYDDVKIWKSDAESWGSTEWFETADISYTPIGTDVSQVGFLDNYSIPQYIIKYDVQFVDEQGNIYPVDEEIAAYADCKHEYEEGQVNRHVKKSDGGCSVIIYSAQRCSKCGQVEIGEEIEVHNYKYCPH